MKQLAAAEDCQQQEDGQEFNLQLQSPLFAVSGPHMGHGSWWQKACGWALIAGCRLQQVAGRSQQLHGCLWNCWL